MKLNDFKLEIFFGKYEFTAPYLLAQSDCEAMSVEELLKYDTSARDKLMKTWLGYSDNDGSPELKERVAKLYKTIGSGDVLIHVGAQEAIFSFMNVTLDKGDHVICMFPGYQSLYEVARGAGCEVTMWNFTHTDKGWTIDIDALERMIKPNTKLIVMNTPNNPTGYVFTDAEIRKMCAIAEKHGIYIFADEVYKGLDLDGTSKPWVCDVYDKAVSLGVMSKAYGLAGLRIGWVATRDKNLLSMMSRYKNYLSICCSTTAETLAAIALDHGGELLARNLGIIKDNLAAADEFFARHSSLFEYNRQQAGPIAFHKINIDEPIGEFCERMVKKSGVLLLPASVYDYDGPYFRMGFGRKSFKQNLDKLEQYLTSQHLA